jgi:hypothetical protein
VPPGYPRVQTICNSVYQLGHFDDMQARAKGFEAYLGGTWHTFDPCNNVPRIGRVLMARGRDAVLTTTFGTNQRESFKVWTDEVSEAALRQPRCLPFVANWWLRARQKGRLKTHNASANTPSGPGGTSGNPRARQKRLQLSITR